MKRSTRGGYGRTFGRGMSRRRFLQLGGTSLAGATLLGTAAACGGGGGTETAEDGSVIIPFAFGPDASGTLDELVRRFNEQYAGEYRADFQVQPADTGAFFDRLRTQFQAGGGNLALIGGDVIWPGQFAANGWIADLSDRFTEDMRSDFLPGPVESNTYDGAVYGVPWFTDFGVMYYRQDLLDDAGAEPPATWDELREMALQISEESNTQNGFVFQGSNYEGGVVNALEYIYSYGGQILSDDSTEVLINSPEAIEALTIERQMIESGASPQSVANFTEMESHTNFLNGDSVFLRNWPYVYGLVTPDQSEITREQVGITTLPAGNGGESSPGLGGWNFYINATTPQEVQDGAWEFIMFASQPEQQRYRALEGGFLPTLSALYEDQEVLEAIPVVEQAGGLDAIANATPRPTSPYYSDMSLVMAEQFNANVNGNGSPEEIVQTTQEELQNIVDQGS